jgi:hypothetical protein
MFSNSYLPFHIRNNRENRTPRIKIHASFKGVGLKSGAGARSSHLAPASRNRNRLSRLSGDVNICAQYGALSGGLKGYRE